MATQVRIDKWLWAVRLYKTRTLAAEACKKGRVSMNGVNLKPARCVSVGDVVQVRKAPVTLSLKVLQAIENRVSAKLVPEMLQDVTPPEQYELLELSKLGGFIDRAKGTGRPTKKERRSLEDFFDTEGDDDMLWDEE